MDLIRTTLLRFFTLHKPTTKFIDSSAAITDRQPRTQNTQTTRKNRSANLTALIFIVTAVGLLHLFGVKCFMCLSELKKSLAKPLVMQVSTIKIPAAKPDMSTTPSPPPTAVKPPRKKPQPKPKLKKIAALAPDSSFAATDQVLEQQPITHKPLPDFAISDPSATTPTEAQPYTEAYLDAAYDRNPKPDYPSIARSRGWQGKVILRVQISEAGKVESVAIENSSSHDLLDESAIAAVKEWLFVPAMQAGKPIASTALVPIIFSLQEAVDSQPGNWW